MIDQPPEIIGPGHPCYDPDGPPDHDMKYEDESFSHEFGTEVCGIWRCVRCGAEDPEREAPTDDYDDDDLDHRATGEIS